MEGKENRIKELDFAAVEENFWDNPEQATAVMRELEELKKVAADFAKLEEQLNYLWEMIDLVEGEKDKKDLKHQIDEFEKDFFELEKKTLLSEEYDGNSAIVSIHAGAGGVDAQDWAEMLLRMYLRFAEKKNFKAKLIDESRGGEAGIKSATFEIMGMDAYGLLKGEAGTHRLVRLSPFNSDNLRQTSFALVEILPIIDEIKEVEIKSEDLKIDTYRSSGAGGQSVNTTDSAVRITHLPTNTVATCQSERSQLQNKERAMRFLLAKLHKKYLEEQEVEKKKMRGEFKSAEWGNQIRSYVLHPYKLVKDHRTEVESNNPEAVLDGDLDIFIEGYLRGKDRL